MPRTLRPLFAAIVLAAAGLPIPTARAATAECLGEPATIVGTSGDDVLVGTQGRDVILARGGDDVIRGLGGRDLICAGPGHDFVLAGRGDDIVQGGLGRDTLYGGPGDDILRGSRGADLLAGGSGDDLLAGGTGGDELIGDGGNDILSGGGRRDTLDGGIGADSYSGGAGADDLLELHAQDRDLDEGTSAGAGDRRLYESVTVRSLDGWVSWGSQRHSGSMEVRLHSDGLVLVEHVAPETYLLGIDEVPYLWPEASLRAQVVAARTYLANLVSNPRWGYQATYGFDICATASCQVYRGAGRVEGTSGDRWAAAVAATTGEILLYGGRPAAALYHSTAGSSTRSIQDVWPGSSATPYLQAVPVDPPENSPFTSWHYTLPLDALVEIMRAGGIPLGGVDQVRTTVTEDGGGPYRVRFQTDTGVVEVNINEVQAALNVHGPRLYPELLPAFRPDGYRYPQVALSPTFTVRSSANGTVSVNGEGWGHQLGMSQYGAQAMAFNGSSYRDILAHFYSGLTPVVDPGFLPDEVAVGLAWSRQSIELQANRLVVASPRGTVLSDAAGVLRLEATGSGYVQLVVQ